MYQIEGDLFDKRSVIAARLEAVLAQRGYTKARFCKEVGISRPTLDKLLSGTITSVTNYEKHIAKVLSCLSMTPEMLLGDASNARNQTRGMRNALRIDASKLAELTGIPLERLNAIEAGEEANIVELRDIALALFTSTHYILGENFFEAPFAVQDEIASACQMELPPDASGYWGHVGILAAGAQKYLWYPITAATRQWIGRGMERKRLVIPCMNNKVLFVVLKNVQELILLDDYSDELPGVDWDRDVSCGEIPLVVYEALPDFFEESEERLGEKMSEKLRGVIQACVEEYGWTEESLGELTSYAFFHMKDGRVIRRFIDYDGDDSLAAEIILAGDFDAEGLESGMLRYDLDDSSEAFINLENVSLIELPLLEVEREIIQNAEED